jgi:hypothetical protein
MTQQQKDEAKFSNISATTAPFVLKGGQYGVTVTATFSSGTVTLQRLGPDGSTYVTALTAFSSAGFATAYLPQGTYRFAIATASAVYAEAVGIVQS